MAAQRRQRPEGQPCGAYGRDESIISNCHLRVAYAPNKVETAEWLSKMVGATTIVKEDITASGARAAAVLPNISRTYHQIARPLMTPDEVMRLRSPMKDQCEIITEPGDMLIFVAGHAPTLDTQSLISSVRRFARGRACRHRRATMV